MAGNNRNRKDPRFNQNWEGHEGRDGRSDRNFDGNSGYNDLNHNDNANRDSDRYRQGNSDVQDGYARSQNYGINQHDNWQSQQSNYRRDENEGRNGNYRRGNFSGNNFNSDRTNDIDRLGSVDNYTGRYGNNFNRDGNRGSGYNESRNSGYRHERYDDNRQEGRGFWDRTVDEVSSWFGDDDAERRRRMDRQQGEFKGRGPKGYRRSDERIKDDINDRLSDDSWIDASDIEVNVENGEVTLTGTVHHRNAKRRAEDLAELVSGVTNVENRIRVQQEQTTNSAVAQPGAPPASTQSLRTNGSQREKSKSIIPN